MPLVKYITKIILIVSMLILDHSLLYGLATTGMKKNLNTMTGDILHTCICMDTPHSIDKCCCTLKVNTSHDYTYIESSCSGSGGQVFSSIQNILDQYILAKVLNLNMVIEKTVYLNDFNVFYAPVPKDPAEKIPIYF